MAKPKLTKNKLKRALKIMESIKKEEEPERLEVFYFGSHNKKTDKTIEKLLAPEYRRVASGYDFGYGKRDLLFEKKEHEHHA